jgi:hypothetical protein
MGGDQLTNFGAVLVALFVAVGSSSITQTISANMRCSSYADGGSDCSDGGTDPAPAAPTEIRVRELDRRLDRLPDGGAILVITVTPDSV